MPETQPQAPEETTALITHIQTRYHDRHRQDLADLLALARRVEDVHWGDPDLPQGLADLVEDLSRDLEEHMAKEETVLFPQMLERDHPMILHPIAAMRRDHEGHEKRAKALAALTHSFTPPHHACGSWQRLYTGLSQLAADLEHYMHLENDLLFPAVRAGDTARLTSTCRSEREELDQRPRRERLGLGGDQHEPIRSGKE